MADFKKSLIEGIRSAHIAASHHSEVDEIFKDLNNQLSDATEGRLYLARVDKDVFNALATFNLKGIDGKASWFISANIKGNPSASVDIAKWYQASYGYPCHLVFDGTKYVCEDRKSLEQGLAAMLSNSVVGAKIDSLLQKNHTLNFSGDDQDA